MTEYIKIDRALSTDDVNELVLSNKNIAIKLSKNNKSKIYLIDIDIKKNILSEHEFKSKVMDELLSQARRLVFNLQDLLKQYNIYSYVEFSGYKGYHLWIFFSKFTECDDMWKILKPIAEKVKSADSLSIEYMPYIDIEQLVKLPFSTHLITNQKTYFLDEKGSKSTKQFEFLNSIKINDPNNISDRFKDKNITYVSENKNTDYVKYRRISDFPEYITKTYENCYIMKNIVDKAINDGYINHYERNAIMYVFGHHGETGRKFVHFIMSKCFNYKQAITEGFLSRMKEKPVSCQKLMQRFSKYSEKCTCRFEVSPMFYSSPVLHGYEYNQNEVTKPDYIDKEERVVEILKINEELKINALSNTLLDLSSKKNEIEKELYICKLELKRIFEERKINSYPVDNGLLIMLQDDFMIKI